MLRLIRDSTRIFRGGQGVLRLAGEEGVGGGGDGGCGVGAGGWAVWRGLQFKRKNQLRPAFKDAGVLGLQRQELERDRERLAAARPGQGPGARLLRSGADRRRRQQEGLHLPGMVEGRNAAVFSLRDSPAVSHLEPDNVQWDQIPFEKRPMVQVERAPFSREAWTHVVFTLENVNDKTKPQRGRLYLNGKLQGTIENWDLTFGWNPERVLLVLGAAYVGDMDDLAVFGRALEDGEVKALYGLEGGVGELHRRINHEDTKDTKTCACVLHALRVAAVNQLGS